MGSIRKATVALIMIMIYTGLTAALTIDEVYLQLIDRYTEIDYYTADFNQINYWRAQNRQIESRGKIYMADDKLAVIFSRPPGQKMVVDDAVYLVDEVERNIIITSIEHTGGLFKPVDVIQFYWEYSEKELVAEEDEIYRIVLFPEDDPYTARIEAEIRSTDFLITAVSYQDHQENRVEFDFFNEQVDDPIDSQIFEVVMEEDYTIIDNRANIPPQQ